MPRAHARIVLGITETRLGRLQDITEEDALAEGIAPAPGQPAIEAFEGLWAFIHGEDGQKSWAANPMVWAISCTTGRSSVPLLIPSPMFSICVRAMLRCAKGSRACSRAAAS